MPTPVPTKLVEVGFVSDPGSFIANGTTYVANSNNPINNIYYYIGSGVTEVGDFSGKSDLVSLEIGSGVTSIGNFAFSDCSNLTSATIGNSVETIGVAAFSYCSALTSVTIGNSVTSIVENAFYECFALESVTIGNSVNTIGNSAFYSCIGLASVTIPNSVTLIEGYAFSYCSALESVTIPDSVTYIDQYAFEGCSVMTTVSIGNSVTFIGNFAFYNCSLLASVTIPASVTTINQNVFDSCIALESVTFLQTSDILTSIGNNVFSNTAFATSGKAYMYSGNTSATSYLKSTYPSVTISYLANTQEVVAGFSSSQSAPFTANGTVYVANSNNPINNIYYYIGSGVTEVGGFSSKSNLVSLEIGSGVTSIGNFAFNQCSELASVTIPDSVTSIGDFAFSGCSALTSVTIGDSVTSIGLNAFYNCSALASVTIGNSVTTIGFGAFVNCSALTSVTFLQTSDILTSIGNNVFSNTPFATTTTANAYMYSANTNAKTYLETNYPNVTISYLDAPCFLEGSKILTDKGYVKIEELCKGELVKTELEGYKKIEMLGCREIHHAGVEVRIKDQLYKCTKENYPEILEDLIMTGCHSILVDEFKNEKEREKMLEIMGKTYITGNKYRLPVCADDRAVVYEKKGDYKVYHVALENDDYYKNYGIYANGLLVESCSKRYLKELSGMELL